MSLRIRDERSGDEASIRRVLVDAFAGPAEADIVERLRQACDDLLSLVAVDGKAIVGHILFSPATLGEIAGMGLAPMAVAPGRQRAGIGTKLVEAGLDRLRASGCPFVIVLGHPEYYPRFGFEPASGRGVRCEWEVPDEAFMMLVLDEKALGRASGLARYRPEFGGTA